MMYDVGFVERYGSGIKMMRRLCEEWENTAPRYELHPLETKVIPFLIDYMALAVFRKYGNPVRLVIVALE